MAAIRMVEATVVAPSRRVAISTGRSRTEAFAMSGDRATRCSIASSSPTFSLPSRTAMVAGTAPSARMMRSTSRAVSRLPG